MIVTLYVKAEEFPTLLIGGYVHASSYPVDYADVKVELNADKHCINPVKEVPGKYTVKYNKAS